jgi:hypothetical protein
MSSVLRVVPDQENKVITMLFRKLGVYSSQIRKRCADLCLMEVLQPIH